MSLDEAITVVKAAGFRVSKPKTSKRKSQRGPTFVCEFADGVITRMTTYTSLQKLDWDRGERLSIAAYYSRWQIGFQKQTGVACPVSFDAFVSPPIISARFEQDGVVLAQRNGGNVP
jgi:hypothetical protein